MEPERPLEPAPKTSRWRNVALVAVPLALVLGLVVFAALKPAEDSKRRLPSFNLPLLSGDGRFSNENLAGKPAVVNFWASWCDPCREETPMLERTYREYRDRGIEFLGVNTQDTSAEARAFAERFGVSYPVVVDEGRALSAPLGVAPLPQTFFVRCDGILMAASGEGEIGAAPTKEATPGLTLKPQPAPGAYFGAIPRGELVTRIEDLLADAGRRC